MGLVLKTGDRQLDPLEIVHGAAVGCVVLDAVTRQCRAPRIEQDDVREAARAHRVKVLPPLRIRWFPVDGHEDGQRRVGLDRPTKPRAPNTSSNAEPRASSMLRSVSVPCDTDTAVPSARSIVTPSDALR